MNICCMNKKWKLYFSKERNKYSEKITSEGERAMYLFLPENCRQRKWKKEIRYTTYANIFKTVNPDENTSSLFLLT